MVKNITLSESELLGLIESCINESMFNHGMILNQPRKLKRFDKKQQEFFFLMLKDMLRYVGEHDYNELGVPQGAFNAFQYNMKEMIGKHQ